MNNAMKTSVDKLYSVEELAAQVGVTARAVRLYMDKGLLDYMKAGRVYCFNRDATQMLKNVLRAKRLGFSLDEIRARFDGSCNLDDQIERVEGLRRDADLELKTLRARKRS